ncbi:helix-turn-helix domain-containing protein [Plesiomonas shigelloides]|nr:helix-turn-helix domain-containing protein [Plesiomonas shigelloides]
MKGEYQMLKIDTNKSEKSKHMSIQRSNLDNDIEICAISLCKITNGRIYIFMNESVHCFSKESIIMLPIGYKISKMDLSFDFSAELILFSDSLLRQVLSKIKINFTKENTVITGRIGNFELENIDHIHSYFSLFKEMALHCDYNATMDGLAFGMLYLIISNKNNHMFNFGGGNTKLHWRVYEIIQANPTFRWKISDIAKALHTSESTLRNSLAKEGLTFREILNDTKLEYAYELISSSQISIKEIVNLFGYTCASQFSAKFKRKYGFPPKELRK